MKYTLRVKPITFLLLTALIAGLGLSTMPARAVLASTIGVTTTNDEINTDGDCSLREAIVAANTDAAVDACPAGSGADVINLPAGNYTLSLVGEDDDASAGDLDITQDLILTGAGLLQTTINANGIDRVIQILSNASVQISRVTVTGGNPSNAIGGNIYLYSGSLTLSHSRVWHSTASAAISASPGATALTVLESRIRDNTGSGVEITGNATALIANSTISGNATDSAGGGVIGGRLTIVNSTISGNSSAFDGGGIYAANGAVYLYNVTITNNIADSDNDSIGSGGGIAVFSPGVLTARNTIIAGNIDNSNPGNVLPDCVGAMISGGYNLIQIVTCTITGDSTGNITNRDAVLGPLQDNGGPTFTHALLTNSPATDDGNPAGCTDQNGTLLDTDQRGYVRNGVCDMGAYEYNSPGTPTPTFTPFPQPPTNTPTPTHTAAPPTATNTPVISPTQTSTTVAGPSATPTATNTPVISPTQTSTTVAGPSATPTANATPGPSPTPAVDVRLFLPLILH